MSSARANANQALYLAKIIHHSWSQALDDGQVPATTLTAAFLPAAQHHLQQAYGWLLLELTGVDEAPELAPPRNCEGLPPVPAGRAVSAELRELQQLERHGYLAQMLSAPVATQAGSSAGGLASVQLEGPDITDVKTWIDSFAGMCERMRNSLDEY